MLGIFQKIFSSANQRRISAYEKVVKKINAIEESYQKESDEQLREKVATWQKHLHRYLPLEIPPVYQIKQMDEDTRVREEL